MNPRLNLAVRALLIAVLALIALLGCMVAALWWWAGEDDSLQWAVEQAQAVTGERLLIEGARGSLRDEIEIERLSYRDERLDLEAGDLSLRLDWFQFLRVAVGLEHLRARSIEVRLTPAEEAPLKPPSSFGLPLRLRVQRAEIGSVAVIRDEERYELADLGFAYAGGPLSHVVADLKTRATWQGRTASVTLDGSLGAIAPFGLHADLALELAEPRAQVRSQWSGSLERPRVNASATLAGARARVEASLAPFAARKLDALRVDARDVDVAVIAPILLPGLDAALPHTLMSIELRSEPATGERFTGSLSAANARAGPVDRQLLPVAKLETRFDTDLASARFKSLGMTFAGGGSVSGEAEIGPGRATASLKARQLNLRSFHSRLIESSLAGPLTLEMKDNQQFAKASLEHSGMSLALDAVRSGERIDVRSFQARAKGGEAKGSAVVRTGQAVSFEAAVELARFDPSQWGDYPAGQLSGTAQAEGTPGTRIAARWKLAASELAGQPLASAGKATILGERPALRFGDVDASASLGATRVEARGAFGAKGDELAWKLDAPRLDALPETPWTARLREVAGSLRSSGTLSGNLDAWRVTFSAQGEDLRGPGGIAAKTIGAKGAAGNSREAPFELALDGKSLDAPNFPLARFAVRSTGTVARHEIRLAASNPMLDFDARLEGSLGGEAWAGRILAMVNRGEYPLDLVAPTPLELSAQRLRLGRLEARFGAGRLLVREASLEKGRLTSSGEFTDIPAAWMLVPAGFGNMKTTLLLGGEWNLTSSPRLNGRALLRRTGGDVRLDVAGIDLGLRSASVDARFTEGALAAQVSLDSRVATVKGTAETVPEPGAAGLGFTPRSPLKAEASVDIAEVRPLLVSMQTQGRISGHASAHLRAGGTLGKPSITGTVRADSLGYDLPPWGLYLRDGRLRAELRGDILEVAELSVRGGDGRFTAAGTLPLRFADGATKLSWNAQSFALLNRPDMRLVLGGSGTTSFDGKRFALQGALTAERGEFEVQQNRLPRLADDIVLVGPGKVVTAPRPKSRMRLPVDLDLQADLGKSLYLRAWGFAGRLGGRLRITTDATGEPRAEGRIDSSNATFEAYGQRLRVEEGAAIFNGPIDNPALQVAAWRRNLPVEAGVQIVGTVQDPKVNLLSEPPVPEGERLSWLVLGRAPGDAGGADIALLQAAAGALFGRRNSPSPQQRIASAFGLDELTVRSSDSISSQVVAVGKRLSDRVYISYEQAVGVTTASLVKLDFSLTRRLSLRAEAGTSSGVGVVYRYSWD